MLKCPDDAPCFSGNYIEFQVTLNDAQSGSHPGPCDNDIEALLTLPYIKVQIDALDQEKLKLELKDYGAWDENELADHEQNKRRILWLACGEIVDTN